MATEMLSIRHALCVLACAGLAACGGDGSDTQIGDGDNATGTLTLTLSDAPVDDVQEVWVQLTGVEVKPGDDDAIVFEFDAPLNVNLLTLTADTTTTLLNDETVPAGDYEWVRLTVNAEIDGTADSYVVDAMGATVEIEVPSQQGLRLVSGFTVPAGGSARFVIDWNVRQGLTAPMGQPGYFLRPALRLVDLAEHGTVTGTVADGRVMEALCDNNLAEDLGNVVYVYDGQDVQPFDIDGTAPEPVTTAIVAQNPQAAGAYTYTVPFLPPGAYTVAFTCQGLAEDPALTDDLVFFGTQSVTVDADEEVTADFL